MADDHGSSAAGVVLAFLSGAALGAIAALLVAPSEREGDVRLCAFGLKDEQWTQLTDR